MKNFYTKSQVEKMIENLLLHVEEPMDMQQASDFLRYKKLNTFYSRYKDYPHHKKNDKIFFFRSELNEYIKRSSDNQNKKDIINSNQNHGN